MALMAKPGAVEDLSREMLREQFEVNLFGTHELTRCIIPIMRAQQSPSRDLRGYRKAPANRGCGCPFTLPSEAVVKSLVQAPESGRPKLRYYVTLPSYLFVFLKRVCRPGSWIGSYRGSKIYILELRINETYHLYLSWHDPPGCCNWR
jgi:NAD(P)-dependent dehydrogenase (short-subunit alcohol dehydrogenase family)